MTVECHSSSSFTVDRRRGRATERGDARRCWPLGLRTGGAGAGAGATMAISNSKQCGGENRVAYERTATSSTSLAASQPEAGEIFSFFLKKQLDKSKANPVILGPHQQKITVPFRCSLLRAHGGLNELISPDNTAIPRPAHTRLQSHTFHHGSARVSNPAVVTVSPAPSAASDPSSDILHLASQVNRFS